MAEEKTERNLSVYLDKMGYEKLSDTKPSRNPLSYRELIQKYDLSYSMLRIIINRFREKE